jgi:hypothetical protein
MILGKTRSICKEELAIPAILLYRRRPVDGGIEEKEYVGIGPTLRTLTYGVVALSDAKTVFARYGMRTARGHLLITTAYLPTRNHAQRT